MTREPVTRGYPTRKRAKNASGYPTREDAQNPQPDPCWLRVTGFTSTPKDGIFGKIFTKISEFILANVSKSNNQFVFNNKKQTKNII